jgi:sulfite reductase (NADPH) flavoprotein alpha-component
MNPPPMIPVLPESAPFTPEQRAYLNGFLAGLLSRAPAGARAAAPAAAPLEPLAILYGSQTGNCEALAKRIAKEAGKRGFTPMIHDLAKFPAAQLAAERNVLVVTSTYGNGEPPDNAKGLWEFLSGPAAPKLPQTRFSVCALGDTNYPHFCAFGKNVDARLEALGAQRVQPRADCDVDFEEPFMKWLLNAVTSLAQSRAGGGAPAATVAAVSSPRGGDDNTAEQGFSRNRPFPAQLVANHRLSRDGSEKDVRHFEIALEGPGLRYAAGDALGVFPTNCPELVDELLRALGCDGEEVAPGRDGKATSLRAALSGHYEIARIPQALLAAVAERAGDATLRRLAAPGANGELTKFLWGRDIVDLLLAHPRAGFEAAEFVALLRKMQPRCYSIASSPAAHPDQAHLTVSVVRYESLGRKRKGVCSTFLGERAGGAIPVPVFVQPNPAFRPPADPAAPMIMVGPGTGIAPFRAFLEERQAAGAPGRNWLFFGDQRSAADFLYREELEALQRDRVLTRLDLAWSRDQAEKIYVQHRMLENARELYGWLEAGAGFYVCGDASRMAKDVDAALHKVIELGGGRSAEQAAGYVGQLQAARRYLRDVY